MKRSIRVLLLAICVLVLTFGSAVACFADDITDEIVNFTITADVNEDATVNMLYHIEWKVLESDGIGPLEWAQIGIPNGNYISYEPLSDTILSMYYDGDNGSSMIINLDKSYYEGETVIFEFNLVQDYMYCMNMAEEGYTTYEFTPAWFDAAVVDNLTIRWNCDKMTSWYPSAITRDGYNEWSVALEPGEMYSMSVTYPNDAFEFDETKWVMSNYDDDYDDDFTITGIPIIDVFLGLICVVISLAFMFWPVLLLIVVFSYKSKSGFGQKKETKITRTRIKYYASCPGCGAVRKDNQTECEYCGHSFLESEEVVKEEDLTDEEKGYIKDGEYKCSAPNTFMRVNVVHIPVPRPTSSHHSSCAHSSCAHSSCACACACACASSGRAGCSTKDFYNTKLKLKNIELVTKKRGK